MSTEVSFDIVNNILSRPPVTTLLRLRSVCKAWKSIIDDPIFGKSHTKNQHYSSSSTILTRNRYGGTLFCLSLESLDYAADGQKELDVIPLKQIIPGGVPRLSELPAPSCHGLILISHKNINKNWAIWNPLLQDFHLLPPPPAPETNLKSVLLTCGIGYDEGSDDYKVVRVDKFYGKKVNDDHYRTRVYSLKTPFWRTIDFLGGKCWRERGVFLDGALHWRSRDGMVVLDLGREVHRLVAGPPSVGRCWESLDALDGCLIWSYGHENLMGVEAWVMEDYGTEKLWTKLFSFETINARGLRIVGYLKSKGQVFFRDRGSGLMWLDIEKKSWRDIYISGVVHSHSLTSGVLHSELSFAQFCPGLVRLDNHKNRRGGVKRKREKAHVSYGESPCMVRK